MNIQRENIFFMEETNLHTFYVNYEKYEKIQTQVSALCC